MPSFGNFIHNQLILKIPIPNSSFASKTVIITGASSGLGKETAKHIVRLGASKVILGCRSTSKGNKAKLEIEYSLQCHSSILEVWEVDLESPSSIKEFVDRANDLSRLDVLINNAGIQTMNFQTVYGTEKTLAFNVIGTFLLALQLVPKLKETAKTFGNMPHMTFVGSALYDAANYPKKHRDDIFAWFNDKNHVDKLNQYSLSKLVLLYLIVKMASIVDPITDDKSQESHSIVINSLDPCFCKTALPGEMSGVIAVLFKLFERIFARPAGEGSSLVVTAASAGRQTHGGYMRAGALQQYVPFITSSEGVEEGDYLWEQLSRKLEQLQPGVMSGLTTV